MTIPSGNGAGGEGFAFDTDQATAAGNKISAFADSIRGLPQLAGAQNGAPSLGSDRVSKAIAGAAHLSERLQLAAGHFSSSVTVVHETEFTNAKSLTALPTTGA